VQLFPIRHRERRAGAQTDRQMTYMQLLAMLRKFYSKFVRVIFEICGWTDRQIDREADGQTGERRTDRQMTLKRSRTERCVRGKDESQVAERLNSVCCPTAPNRRCQTHLITTSRGVCAMRRDVVIGSFVIDFHTSPATHVRPARL